MQALVTEKPLSRILREATNQRLFERVGYDAKACAQRNLEGRTHYADDATLKFFHARILRCGPAHDGAVLGMVESVAADMNNTRRIFRFTVFDVFGTELTGRDVDYPNGDKAGQALADWLAAFDPRAHYRAALTERATRLRREAEQMESGAAAI